LAARAHDDELVGRCRSGDLSAFEAIYRRHSGPLYSLAYRMVGNPNDAEDLLQEIFLLAYNKLPSYQGQAALGTWLYRVATNRCLDYLRSRASRNQAITESLDDKDRPLSSAPTESTPERLDIEESVAKLPDSYRAAFLLYDVEGFEHKEVAEILGVAEGTSKSLVHKARLKIREHLGQTRGGARQ
jgi:RNA polymerase sigma-70 factor (ECF subfamily)